MVCKSSCYCSKKPFYRVKLKGDQEKLYKDTSGEYGGIVIFIPGYYRKNHPEKSDQCALALSYKRTSSPLPYNNYSCLA